jgi:hypothetical protein
MNLRSLIKHIFNLLGMVIIVAGICVSNSVAAPSTSIVGSKHDFSFSNATGPGHFAGFWQVGGPSELGPIIEEICVFCHTPHHSASSADAIATQTNKFLWNRVSSPPVGSSYTYKTYTSSSSTIVAPDTADKRPTGISMMCMSCHDGVTSIAVNVNNNINTPTLLNPPNAEGLKAQVSIDPFQVGNMASPGAIGNIFTGNPTTGGWGANIGNAQPGIGNTIDMSNDHPISFEWNTGKAGYFDTPQNSALRLFGSTGRRIECATCHTVHNPSIEPFLAMSNAQSLMCRACHIK